MAELRAYHPTWRDQLANLLIGDRSLTPSRRRFVEGLVGSSGLGTTGMSLIDLTPAGIPLAGQEAQRAAAAGDWVGAATNAMAVIPAAKPAAVAARTGARVMGNPLHTVFATYETTPGRDIGHLPILVDDPYHVRVAYAKDPRSSMTGPGGGDIVAQAFGMRTLPTRESTGRYGLPGGQTDTNPAFVARPQVELVGRPGAQTLSPESRSALNAGEGARAFVGGQNAGAWSTPIRNDVDLSRSLFLPLDRALTPERLQALEAAGAKHGLPHVVDYGGGAILTNLRRGELPSPERLADALDKHGLRKELADAIPGVKPTRVQIESGYVGFEDAWRKPPGSGAVTRQLREVLIDPNIPGAIERLDRSPLRESALAQFERDAERASMTGEAVREDLQLARQIIHKEGFSGLFRALDKGLALPVALIAPIVAAAQGTGRPDLQDGT